MAGICSWSPVAWAMGVKVKHFFTRIVAIEGRNSMRKTETKKAYFYPIKDVDGSSLDLMNVLSYVKDLDGKLVLDRVDAFIGRSDRDEFEKVAHTEGLSAPGVIFRYASYVQEQEMFLDIYLQIYHDNLKGKVYTETGAYYVLK